MNIFQIILIGLMLTAVGSAVIILSAPLFGIDYKTVFKRSLWFIIGCEAIVALIFCIFNGVRPSFWGQLLWHAVRFMQLCILSVINNKLHNIPSDKKQSGTKRYAILHVVVASLLTQFLQYQLITLIY